MTNTGDPTERHATESKRDHYSRRRLLAGGIALGGGILAGCLGGDEADSNTTDAAGNGNAGSEDMDDSGGMGTETGESMDDSDGMETETDDGMESMETTAEGDASMGWQSTELTDVRSDETFSVSEFDGPVVVETFAVWCPKCTKQQNQLRGLATDDDVTVVSINVDPNEDAQKVAEHANQNGFGWNYAVAPTEMTKSLTDAFGPTVLNAPSSPVIVVCPDGSASMLESGIKSTSEIETAVEDC